MAGNTRIEKKKYLNEFYRGLLLSIGIIDAAGSDRRLLLLLLPGGATVKVIDRMNET